ncbi:MAG: hypothetical protein ABWZ79_07940 [Pedobacter agri]
MVALNELEKISWAIKYTEYIILRKKGLKKQSKLSLAEFVKEYGRQPANERRSFINIIYNAALQNNDYSTYLPQDLYKNIILPEIKEWIKDDPGNPIPYKWSNDLNDNKKSLLINPYDQVAIESYANEVIGKISMNQHEIASGYAYDGSPAEDIEMINFLEGVLINSNNFEKRKKLIEILSDLKETALRHLN